MNELTKLIEALGRRHGTWKIFSDFLEMASEAVSNAVDLRQREARESRYLETIAKYSTEEQKQFPVMLGKLVDLMSESVSDVLGKTFHELELHNKYHGQFFFAVRYLSAHGTGNYQR